jgi:site-specific DNA recombinase
MRDLVELLDLCDRHDVGLVSVCESLDTSTAGGRMIVNVLGVFAQFEREQIGERTRTALTHKRRRGEVYGPTPFGFRREGMQLRPVADEQLALGRALQMHEEGEPLEKIGEMLESRGLRPRRGVRWHRSTIRAMLGSRATTELIPA